MQGYIILMHLKISEFSDRTHNIVTCFLINKLLSSLIFLKAFQRALASGDWLLYYLQNSLGGLKNDDYQHYL